MTLISSLKFIEVYKVFDFFFFHLLAEWYLDMRILLMNATKRLRRINLRFNSFVSGASIGLSFASFSLVSSCLELFLFLK